MKLKSRVWLALLFVAIFVGSYWAKKAVNTAEVLSAGRERIIAMAPSSGEILFELGLGERVVGVSRFMEYPEAAVSKPKIGGYLDVDKEAIVRLEPDVVVLLKEQSDLATQLEALGMQTVLVDHMSVGGILDSVSLLGEFFSVESKSTELRQSLEQRIQKVSDAKKEGAKQRVLLSIGREFGTGKVTGLVAAGAAGYHQELLTLAHLENAYQGSESFPQLSREHLIIMNPDVIVDMVNSKTVESVGIEKIRADWASHPELKAVAHGKVFILVGNQHFIPGPRFIETLEWIDSTVNKGGGHE